MYIVLFIYLAFDADMAIKNNIKKTLFIHVFRSLHLNVYLF